MKERVVRFKLGTVVTNKATNAVSLLQEGGQTFYITLSNQGA